MEITADDRLFIEKTPEIACTAFIDQVKNMTKLRIISVALLLALALSLSACSKPADEPTQSAQPSQTWEQTETTASDGSKAVQKSETVPAETSDTTTASAPENVRSAPDKDDDASAESKQNGGDAQSNTNSSNTNGQKDATSSGSGKPAPTEQPTAAPAVPRDRDNAEVSINDL